MHEHTGAAAGAMFVAMWTVMMVAMMLPSLVPALARSARPLALALGYFGVWGALGAVVYGGGAGLTLAAVRQPALARALPVIGAMVVLLAAMMQFTGWKARHLAHLRAAHRHPTHSASPAAEWRRGLRLGVSCICSCAGPTAILLVLGAMDLRAMAIVAVVITAERGAPRGVAVAHAAGAAAAGLGLLLLASAW